MVTYVDNCTLSYVKLSPDAPDCPIEDVKVAWIVQGDGWDVFEICVSPPVNAFYPGQLFQDLTVTFEDGNSIFMEGAELIGIDAIVYPPGPGEILTFVLRPVPNYPKPAVKTCDMR